MTVGADGTRADVVRDHTSAAAAELEPLLVLEPLEEFLDAAGLGSGPIEAEPIGEGHSNVTFLLLAFGLAALELLLRATFLRVFP